MSSRTPKLSTVLDASALLAYLQDENGSELVSEAIGRGSYVSSVNWAEVLSKLAQHGIDPNKTVKTLKEEGVLGEGIVVVPFEESQALEVAKLYPVTKAKGLSLGDRACLSLALARSVSVLTTDRAWGDLKLKAKIIFIR
jgi:ribonuclease VapC